jgi:hypothetical protein
MAVNVAETSGYDLGRYGRERRAQANRCGSVEKAIRRCQNRGLTHLGFQVLIEPFDGELLRFGARHGINPVVGAVKGHVEPVLINGGQTIKSLSAVFLADLERHWRVHGPKVLDVLAEKYPQAYFSGMVALSKVIRWEVGQADEIRSGYDARGNYGQARAAGWA